MDGEGLRVDWTVDGGGERYMGEAAAVLVAAGYRVAERFTEGADVFDAPDHVIRIDLGGPIADLIWDTLCWKIITYPYSGSTASDDLSRVLTDQADARPRSAVASARPVLDEARRRWGGQTRLVEDIGPPALTYAEIEALMAEAGPLTAGTVPIDTVLASGARVVGREVEAGGYVSIDFVRDGVEYVEVHPADAVFTAAGHQDDGADGDAGR